MPRTGQATRHRSVLQAAAAQRHCELGLDLARASGRLNIDFFGYDHRVRAFLALARGVAPGLNRKVADGRSRSDRQRGRPRQPDQHLHIAHLHYPDLHWVGEHARAEELVERLIGYAAKHSLRPCRRPRVLWRVEGAGG